MTSHCSSPIYVGDKYCIDCGSEITAESLPKDIIDIAPSIINNVQGYYPNVYSITGVIESTYIYKRGYSNSKDDVEYTYIWIKLRDKKGELIETSISAESDYLLSIKKGDVVTLYYPSGFHLNYKIITPDAKRFVKDNSCAPCVFVHLEDSQRVSSVPQINPYPKKAGFWMGWLVMIAVAALLVFGLNVTQFDLFFWGAVLISGIGTFVYENTRNQKKFNLALQRYHALKQSIDDILEVTYVDLGYQYGYRLKQNSDILCMHCNKRVPSTGQFCVACGSSIMSLTPALSAANKTPLAIEFEHGGIISGDSDQSDASSMQLTVSEATTDLDVMPCVPAMTVGQIEADLLQKHYLYYQDEYVQDHVFHAPQRHDIRFEFFLGQVLTKDINNKVSDETRTVTTTTETKYYENHIYSHSRFNTTTEHYRNRSSTVSGNVIVRFNDDQECTLTLSEKMLSSLDVGDWLVFSASWINKHYYTTEYQYNLNKDVEIYNDSFSEYTNKLINGWVVLALIILTGLSLSMPPFRIALAALLLYTFVMYIVKKRQNRIKRNKLMARFRDKIKEFKLAKNDLKFQLDCD